MKIKKYKPCKTVQDLIDRQRAYIRLLNKGSDWKIYIDYIPVEIFGLDLKGKSGSFNIDDLVKYL